ncbi:MAG: divergent polysaccharide deacetylase family protein, partial [Desulfonatronovibrionaceae bacterium]
PDDSTWHVRINGERTHTLFLRSDAPGKRPEPSGKLAIVIDDMGRSRKAASRLAELDFPVTFSILPHSAFSKTVRRIATASKLPIMLHLPMQPDNWPDTDPGPGALFVDMSRDKIRQTARQDLDLVPEAIGVNNHMGSRFTAYQAGMEELFRELRDRELFFLDSLTTPQSVASRISGRFGINLLKRDIFLDNIQDKTAIIFQLRKAEKIASDTGLAIAIGHPYPETLDALETWNKNRDNGVEVVGINDLL